MAEPSSTKNKSLCYEYDSDVEEDEDEVIDMGISMEVLNFGPRKKLLIMGLGGFLCHRVFPYDSSKVPTHRRPDASHGIFFVYKRPYCEDFMKFCLERFEVGIWSSSREWYMNNALDLIMRGLKSKLLFAWDQTECTRTGFNDLENKDKPIFLKELKKFWGEKGAKLLRLRRQCYSSSNTMLIDNEPYKALLNPPHTAIFPDEYKAELVIDQGLGAGSEQRLYLEEVAEAEDIPSFVKKHPFGKPPISPQQVHWDYYSKIIHNCGSD